jgi:hypothetical protein
MHKCAYCGDNFEKLEHSIHRDGFGDGPEVPLCEECYAAHTCEEIWQVIAKRPIRCTSFAQYLAIGARASGSIGVTK